MKYLLIKIFCLIICFTIVDVHAQQNIVIGKITTSDGKPAAFVNITFKEDKKTVMSREDGSFAISIGRECTCSIVVSFTGLKTQEKKVTIGNGEIAEINFQLEENSMQLNEIIVSTARGMNDRLSSIGKLPVPSRDLPQSIVVIDHAVLEKQQVLTMSEALQNVNGVYIMGTTGGYQEEIAARGYAFNSSNTFKNGIRFNNGIRTEFSSVEKVEILKGGSAILFGNVAAGGILNIVTKKPKFERGGEVSLRTGSYDLYKPSFDIFGAFNKSKWAAYRLNSSYDKAGSFREGVKSERFYINPSFLFKPGKNTELVIEGDYLKDNRTPDFGVGAINYSFVNVPRSRTLNVPGAYLNTEQYTATATATHHLNDKVDLRGIASYQNFYNEMYSAVRPASVSISSDGKWLRGLQKSKTSEAYYFSSLDLTAKIKTGLISHTLFLGADADKYNTQAYTFATYRNNEVAGSNKNVYDSINIFDPSTFNTRNDIPFITAERITTSPVIRYGIYIQDLISVFDNLKVLAGVRYTSQNNHRAIVDTLSKATKGYINAYENDAFSPRFGIVYQPCKTTSVFASYTNTFTVNTGTDVNNQALPPSTIDQYEAGVKNDFFKGALSTNLTFYTIVNSNLAQTALFFTDGTANTNSNIKELSGETTSKGVELDIMTKPVKGFNIIAGYSYNDMRYTEVNNNTVNGNIKGDRLRYNPATTANANVFYNFSNTSLLKGFYIGAGAFYVGNRLAGRNPTNNPGNTNKLMSLPDYTIIDINAGYALNNFAVRFKISNLINKLSYNAHDDNSINPIAPRQFAASFSYKY
ncbi:MAG: TonB-dependent receptor [Ginsengibacter sp.]